MPFGTNDHVIASPQGPAPPAKPFGQNDVVIAKAGSAGAKPDTTAGHSFLGDMAETLKNTVAAQYDTRTGGPISPVNMIQSAGNLIGGTANAVGGFLGRQAYDANGPDMRAATDTSNPLTPFDAGHLRITSRAQAEHAGQVAANVATALPLSELDAPAVVARGGRAAVDAMAGMHAAQAAEGAAPAAEALGNAGADLSHAAPVAPPARPAAAADIVPPPAQPAAPVTPASTGQSFVRRYQGTDYPVQIIGEPQQDYATGRTMIKVRGDGGAEGFVPHDEVFPSQPATPVAPPHEPLTLSGRTPAPDVAAPAAPASPPAAPPMPGDVPPVQAAASEAAAPVQATPSDVSPSVTPSSAAPAPTSDTYKAAKILQKDLVRSGNPNALDMAQPWQTTAEAVGGNTSRRLAALATNPDLPASSQVEQAVAERVASVPDQVRKASQDAFEIDPRKAMQNVRDYIADARSKATPLYDDLNDNTGLVDSPRLRQLMELPDIKAALPKAARNVAGLEKPTHFTVDEPTLPDALPSGARTASPMGRRAAITSDGAYAQSQNALEAMANGDHEGVTPTYNQTNVPSMEVWDHVKRELDRAYNAEIALPGASQNDSRVVALEHQRSELVKALDQAVSKYASVREAGGLAPTVDTMAYKAKRLFSNATTNDEFNQQLAMASKDERQAVLNSHLSELETRLGKPEIGGMDGNQNLTLYTSPNYRQRLAALAGQKNADQFVDAIGQIEASRKSGLRLLPNEGSKTMPMGAAKDSLNADAEGILPTVGSAILNPGKAAGKLMESALTKMYQDKVVRRMSTPVLNELGRMYLQDPKATQTELDALSKTMKATKAAVSKSRGRVVNVSAPVNALSGLAKTSTKPSAFDGMDDNQ